MRSKVLAPISFVLFAFSYAYFLHVVETVYDPGAEINYIGDMASALAIPLVLALVLALLIWLFKRHSYTRYLHRSLAAFCTFGISVDLLAIFLMFRSVANVS